MDVFAEIRRTTIVLRRLDNCQFALYAVPVAIVHGVAMKPAGALQQQVDRRPVGYHQIKVDIEALLDHLRRNHDGAPLPIPIFAKFPKHLLLDVLAPDRQKPAMEQDQVVCGDVQFAALARLIKQAIHLLYALHPVTDNRCVAALLKFSCIGRYICCRDPSIRSDLCVSV